MKKRIMFILGGGAAAVVLLATASVLALAAGYSDKTAAPDTPYPAIAASTDPAVIARGEYLVHGVAHCSQCHMSPERDHPELLRENAPLKGGLLFDQGIAKAWAPNLTPDPETGIGKRTDAELARTIRHGVLSDGRISIFMGYSSAKVSDEDLIAIISYLRAQPPVHNPVPPAEIGTLGKALLAAWGLPANLAAAPKHVPESAEPTIARGEYLAEHVALCVACHSQIDMGTMAPTGPKAAGGMSMPSAGPDGGTFTSPNLTSHATGWTGKLDEEGFVARIRAGRTHTYSIMPWENFGKMTDSDLRSIYRYLKSLPPIDNEVGPTFR